MDALKDVVKSREYIGKQKRKVLENQDTSNEECQLQQQDVYNNHWNYKYMDRPGTMAMVRHYCSILPLWLAAAFLRIDI